jgi:hypothetical protein
MKFLIFKDLFVKNFLVVRFNKFLLFIIDCKFLIRFIRILIARGRRRMYINAFRNYYNIRVSETHFLAKLLKLGETGFAKGVKFQNWRYFRNLAKLPKSGEMSETWRN